MDGLVVKSKIVILIINEVIYIKRYYFFDNMNCILEFLFVYFLSLILKRC